MKKTFKTYTHLVRIQSFPFDEGGLRPSPRLLKYASPTIHHRKGSSLSSFCQGPQIPPLWPKGLKMSFFHRGDSEHHVIASDTIRKYLAFPLYPGGSKTCSQIPRGLVICSLLPKDG